MENGIAEKEKTRLPSEIGFSYHYENLFGNFCFNRVDGNERLIVFFLREFHDAVA